MAKNQSEPPAKADQTCLGDFCALLTGIYTSVERSRE
jgi:hypothetical protein